jgi:class 3 adenylate cyclase
MRKGWFFIIPAIIIGICAGVYYTPLYSVLDKELFGLLEHIRPPAGTEQNIVHLKIEKPYPDRELFGKGVTALRDLGAEVLVFAMDFDELYGGGGAYLGETLTGNAYVPLYASAEAAAEELFSLKNAEVREEFPFRLEGFRAPSLPLPAGAGGGGFLYSDESAARNGNKLPLIRGYEKTYYPHVIFAAVLGWMRDPSVFIYRDRAVLRNAAVPGREMKDVVVPFTESGDVYVRGPGAPSYPFTPYIQQEENIGELYSILRSLEEKNLLTPETGGGNLTEIYRSAELLRQRAAADEVPEEDLPGVSEKRTALRDRFLREAGTFFFGNAESVILDGGGPAGAEAAEIEELFTRGRRLHKEIADKRGALQKTADGAFCIITYEDIPAEAAAAYTAAVHTLITEDFIDDFPWWYSLIAASILAFLLMFVLTRLKPAAAIIIGLPAAALFAGLPLISFYFFAVYLPLFFPAAAAGAVYLAAAAVQISAFTREKRNITVRFFSSVPKSRMGDVAEMYAGKAGVTGIKLPMSVLYAKIGNQASIIRDNSPEDVMKMYTAFADMVREGILSLEGLVGGIDGGTGWGVWGAFSEDTSDAMEACNAALALRKRLQDEKHPFTLVVSLTSGDGIRGKKVTLSSTGIPVAGLPVLQGEKILQAQGLYGVPVIAAGKIHTETGDRYLFRRLDRVRIEGFTESIRLYELIGTPEAADEKKKTFLDIYTRALSLFEKQEWKQAHKLFIEALQIDENDKTAVLFARRCQKFVKDPPSASWDGTFSIL